MPAGTTPGLGGWRRLPDGAVKETSVRAVERANCGQPDRWLILRPARRPI